MKKQLKALLVAAALIISVVWFFKGRSVPGGEGAIKGDSNLGKVTLFFGSTCPHCEVVEEWLEANSEVKKKSGLKAKEVYNDRDNSQELTEKAAECEISGGIGVPFLYDHGECIVGDQPIIDHLERKYQ